MKLPSDLANGMTLTLLKNLPANSALPKLSMVVATPKPRLVKLELSTAGEDPFSTGSVNRKATHYVVKIDIGGLAGLVLGGEAPAFVKSDGALFLGGPMWRIELTSPVWPTAPRPTQSRCSAEISY